MKSKLLMTDMIYDFIDYPRIFVGHNLAETEAYLMVCEEKFEYDFLPEWDAEYQYSQDDKIKKIYIDIGDEVIIRYYKNDKIAFTGGTIEDIDWEDETLYMKCGEVVDITTIESIGLV